jgi:DNA-binding CsgD family transcriptional regulator
MTTEETDPAHGGVTVVEFELSDPTYPFVGLSEAEDCRVTLEKMLPRRSGAYAEFFRVLGADPDTVLDIAAEDDLVESTVITRSDSGGLFEFVVDGFCPARALAERGAIPQTVVGEAGQGRIRAEIPAGVDTSSVISGFIEEHPDAELRSKQTTDRATPLFTKSELEEAVDERLTDRQREVLETAYDNGYYEVSKDITGEEVGDLLGITAPTVSQHLQAAERKLVSMVLDDEMAG